MKFSLVLSHFSVVMALFRYFQPVSGLPDPKGSLSSAMPSQAIAQANREVQDVINKEESAAGATSSTRQKNELQ